MMLISVLMTLCVSAFAHGERNQEPFLRLRTVHFFDMQWSADKLKVNDELVVTGKFRLFTDWPNSLSKPDMVFLGNGTPGPVLARTESYINGIPAAQSGKLEIDRDYEFKTVYKARLPGRHHVHPMLNVLHTGGLLGPGKWVEISGDREDFKLGLTTIDGTKIDNLETWGLGTVYAWNAGWFIAALVFMLWWLRKPFLMPRFRAVMHGFDDKLVTRGDRIWGATFLVATVVAVIMGANWAEAKYPRTIPLQGGEWKVEPLPMDNRDVHIAVKGATYDVPGRSMKFVIEVKNNGTVPVQVGEFSTSNLRFINQSLPAAVAGVHADFPKEQVPPSGLKVDDQKPILPGETRTIKLDATDAAWELERLTAMLGDPDNRIGGLLFFYDANGKRHIANVFGPILPIFSKI